MKIIVMLFLFHQSVGLFLNRRNLLKTVPLLAVNQDDKFCKNCKFFKKEFSADTKFGHCSRFPNEPINNYYLVDGYKDKSPTSYQYCATARSSDRMCGPEGKYYESRG